MPCWPGARSPTVTVSTGRPAIAASSSALVFSATTASATKSWSNSCCARACETGAATVPSSGVHAVQAGSSEAPGCALTSTFASLSAGSAEARSARTHSSMKSGSDFVTNPDEPR